MPGCSRCKRRGTRRCPRPWRPPMTELVIAALMTAVVTYGMSATAKLRSGQAYRAFRAGLAATALVSRPLTGLDELVRGIQVGRVIRDTKPCPDPYGIDRH